MTGIESVVKQRYGLKYWKRYEKDILKTADRHGNLDYAPVKYNSDAKRAMKRHPKDYSLKDLEKAKILKSKKETWKGNLKTTVARDPFGRFIKWLAGWEDLDDYDD